MADSAHRVYAQCGMTMRSPVELHLPEADGARWDVDIDWRDDPIDTSTPPTGEVVAELDLPDEGWWYKATWTGSEYVLRFHDCGEFRISPALDRVEVRASPSEQSAILPVLMAGTVSSFILTLRGTTILHASAVAIDGRVLAFVGPSGRGKTTMATLLCTVGAELVTDDVLAVQPGPPPTCIGGASELRLREAAASLAEGGAARRTTADDRIALSVRSAPPVELPLDAIVVPGPSRESTELELTLLTPSNALLAFLAFPRVYGWARQDVLARDFAVFGALVNEVPMYTATIPWGPPFDPAVALELVERTRRDR